MAARRRLAEELRSAYEGMLSTARETSPLAFSATVTKAAASGAMLSESAGYALTQAGRIQAMLRPLYGKAGVNPPKIGDHPDFAHLENTTELEFSPITTMFMDIESSTRLGLLFDLPTVYRIKNTFILATLEIVKAFDGHVHRIMGDAVMAYFGRRAGKPQDGVVDGINCAAMLTFFVQNSVIPRLKQENPQSDFGIRIGVDHGPKDHVLWSCYGYPSMCEVTATSFYVDVASKLQHQASRNGIMIGEQLRSVFDLHDELVHVPIYSENGKRVSDPYVRPNHTRADGSPLNYRKWELDAEEYLLASPVAPIAQEVLSPATALRPLVVRATVHMGEKQPKIGDLASSGKPVEKQRHLAFRIQPPDDLVYPCNVRFNVENHGADARQRGGETYGNHSSEYSVNNTLQLGRLEHWEHTNYTGFHYMIAEIESGGATTHRGRFGVFVE